MPRTRPAKHDIRGFLISLISPIAPISPQFERLQNPSMSTSPAPTLRSQCSAFNITLIQQTFRSLHPSSNNQLRIRSYLLHLCLCAFTSVHASTSHGAMSPSHKHFRAPTLLKNVGTYNFPCPQETIPIAPKYSPACVSERSAAVTNNMAKIALADTRRLIQIKMKG